MSDSYIVLAKGRMQAGENGVEFTVTDGRNLKDLVCAGDDIAFINADGKNVTPRKPGDVIYSGEVSICKRVVNPC